MEHVVRHLRFRVHHRNRTQECEGRSVVSPDGLVKIQMWQRTPEQPNILLEVAPVADLHTAWRHFRALCVHRGLEVQEYREREDDGAFGEWKPLPGDA